MLTQKNLNIGKTPITRTVAILEEFPWIKDVVYGDIVEAHISEIKEELLTYCPESAPAGDEELFFVNKKGERINYITMLATERKFPFFWKNVIVHCKKPCVVSSNEYFYPNLISAIRELKKHNLEIYNEIRYVVSCYRYYDQNVVIIYFLPVEATMEDWIRWKIDNEKEKLKKEIVDFDFF